MIERPVTFVNEGMQIVGMLQFPEGKGKKPAVILVHGFTDNKLGSHRIFVHTGRKLAKEGIICLRFDCRGSGESEGDFIDMTISGEISDLKAAVDYLYTLPEVDTERIGVLGYSLGSVVAICCAVEDQRIKAVCTWAAEAEDQYERFHSDYPEMVEKWEKGEVAIIERITGIWQLGPSFYLDIKKNMFNTLKGIKKVSPRPVCFIAGEGDQVLDPTNSMRLYLEATEPKKIVIIKGSRGANMHVWRDLESTQELYKQTINWFKKNLLKKQKTHAKV